MSGLLSGGGCGSALCYPRSWHGPLSDSARPLVHSHDRAEPRVAGEVLLKGGFGLEKLAQGTGARGLARWEVIHGAASVQLGAACGGPGLPGRVPSQQSVHFPTCGLWVSGRGKLHWEQEKMREREVTGRFCDV